VTIRVPTLGNGTGNWHCLLDPGDVGVPVARLQIGLNDCHNAGLAVDSDYGPKTTSAVAAVQRAFGLSADGIAGPQTISHMEWPIKQLVGLGPPFACDPIDL
jgi:peptidoglycan hydrolase-like protein with peptidoglycan-binding domain